MVPSLLSKAKVVRRSLLFLFLLLGYRNGSCQTLNHTQKESISFNFRQTPLGEVVTHISRVSGLNFIYSSNKIDVQQLISLQVANKSIEDVLEKLSTVAQLTFKQHNQYVVIKATAAPQQPQFFSAVTSTQHRSASFDSSAWTHDLLARIHAYGKLERPSASEIMLARYLPQRSTSFNADVLNDIPSRYIDAMQKQQQRKNWFLSVGSIINEYSAGAEIQFGHRSLYAVGNLAVLDEAALLPGVGIGASFALKQNFSFNPVYTYNFRRYQESINKYDNANIDVKSGINRLKLMLQYTRFKNVGLRAGITFNQITSEYTYPEPPRFEVPQTATGFTVGFQTPKNSMPPTQRYSHYSNGTFTWRGQTTKSIRVWMGWEAGISYRFDLFR